MTEEMNIPEFLQRDFEKIMDEMIGDIPRDIDMSEGNHPYNLLAPTAKQEEYFAQYIMAEALKRIFPKFCEGYSDFVDYHAEVNGLSRKLATYATGKLMVVGKDNTVIPAGTVFSTISVNDMPSVGFVSTEEVIIGESGTAEVNLLAKEAGVAGNVTENTILLQDSPIEGIERLTNPEAMSGGIDEESDESLIQRIMEYEEMQGLSFVGNDSDYKRWAEEVNGTGTATVVPPQEEDDSGKVTIILTDSLGKPATEELCGQVYDYIVSPGDRDKRKAPVNGAVVEVVPPVVIEIKVSAVLELTDDATLESVKTDFLRAMATYMAVVPEEKEVRYTKVAAILSGITGVKDFDYASLLVNDATENVAVAINEFPQVTSENVIFTESGAS